MREQFNLDSLPSHDLEPLDPDAQVVNPVRRARVLAMSTNRPAPDAAGGAAAGGRPSSSQSLLRSATMEHRRREQNDAQPGSGRSSRMASASTLHRLRSNIVYRRRGQL